MNTYPDGIIHELMEKMEYEKRGQASLSTGTMFHLRGWQLNAWQKRHHRALILNAMVAAGKSGFIQPVAIEAKEEGKTVLVFVPQNTNAADLESIYKQNVEWYVDREFKQKIGTWDTDIKLFGKNNKVNAICNQITSKMPSINVCCYQTGIAAIKKLYDDGYDLSNLLIVFDEAHHINSDPAFKNGLGEILEILSQDPSNNFLFCTGTYYRTDAASIVPASLEAEFFHLGFYEMITDREICEHLKYVSQDIRINDATEDDECGYYTSIHHLYEENENIKTGIWLPTNCTGGDQVKFVKNTIKSLGDVVTDKEELKNLGVSYAEQKRSSGKVVYIKRHTGKLIRMVDLAIHDELLPKELGWSNRAEREDYFNRNKEGRGSIDLITSLFKVREGANWIPLARTILCGFRVIGDSVQIMGRGFRDYKGKDHLYVHHLLPYGRIIDDSDESKQWANQLINHLWASLFLVEDLYPMVHRLRTNSREAQEQLERAVSIFKRTFEDCPNLGQLLLQRVSNRLEIHFEDGGTKQEKYDYLCLITDNELLNLDMTIDEEYKKSFYRCVWLRLCVSNMDRSATQIPYEMVIEDGDPIGCTKRFISKLMSKKHAKKYKSFLSSLGDSRINNTEKFVDRAKEVHNNKFDYSKTKFVDSYTKVTIICPFHGEFLQAPTSHICGRGCAKCSNIANLTTEEFISRSIEKYGDRFDYRETVYKNQKTKVKIICKKHGIFETLPPHHLKCESAGCQKCTGRVNDTESFIEKAVSVWGDFYDYSKVKYKSAKSKVVIICPFHGEFEQTPDGHLNSKKGCRKCAIEKTKKSKDDVLKQLKEIHGEKFDYTNISFDNTRSKIDLICDKHGTFSIRLDNHLSGKGCPACSRRMNKGEFVSKSIDKHGDRYDYSEVYYIDGETKVKIRCKKHGFFMQKPCSHLTGKGCPKCNKRSKKVSGKITW